MEKYRADQLKVIGISLVQKKRKFLKYEKEHGANFGVMETWAKEDHQQMPIDSGYLHSSASGNR